MTPRYRNRFQRHEPGAFCVAAGDRLGLAGTHLLIDEMLLRCCCCLVQARVFEEGARKREELEGTM